MMTNHVKHPLDEKTVRIIKATVPVLEEHGEAITTLFYKRLFENYPELKNIFNQTHQRAGDQPRALANMVYMAALHIENLGAVLPQVRTVAEKHRSLNVQPEHYPIVGEYLLKAMKEVLGEQATDEVLGAWGEAYGVIAGVFIDVEKDLYEAAEDQKGGWADWRLMQVVDKVKESDEMTSFYLQPEDERPLPRYKAGQYITVKAEIEGESYDHLRQYSLSDAPGSGYFRITVKREAGSEDVPAGIVSTWLHDHVNVGDALPVSVPAGDFHLDDHKRPLVLISGGAGLTPLMSMQKEAAARQPERDIYVVHAARSGSVHAFREEMMKRKACFVYEQPTEEDIRSGSFHERGFINLDILQRTVPKDAEFYFCGPKGFMTAVYSSLIEWGVKEDAMHYEFFGPQEALVLRES
ncbi:NO-inducible flavohemoprotein [Halobacillus kuroshimensis]|uniref:Flavohemoprotein n=2 Tax=Halobacillus kuroshimensis TaxID=302481 RepID=A0ABS3DYZ6_9BACI|nr:NO-inducible flavohemoprotein [Halobacillus kuroshimensis]MBN8236468.1 NO-inducible flavohemoprotein [Halobacillus kuroshimensis]